MGNSSFNIFPSFLWLVLFSVFSYAGEPGVDGATFLKIGAGPRAISMGEAQTAVANDAYASYWNPSGLSQLQFPEVAFTYHKSFQDIRQEFASFAIPLKKGTVLGGSFTHLSVSPFSSFDASGVETGQVSSSDWAAMFSWAQKMNNLLHFGMNGKIIRSRLGPTVDSTHAFDFGVLLNSPASFLSKLKPLRMGFATKNIGPGLVFDEKKTRLPQTNHLGFSYKMNIRENPFISALDYNFSSDHRPYFTLGSELWLAEMLALRGGYRFGQDVEDGFRAGIGLGIKNLELSYSISPFGFLGEAHRFGVQYRFQPRVKFVAELREIPFNKVQDPEPNPKRKVQEVKKPKKKKTTKRKKRKVKLLKQQKIKWGGTVVDFIELGKSQMRLGRFKEAASSFSRALQIEPNHKVALKLMRQSIKNINNTKKGKN